LTCGNEKEVTPLMKITDIIKVLNAELLTKTIDITNVEIDSALSSDFMSDIIAYIRDNVILLTGLLNPQVIRTAEMLDIKAVVFVRGKRPSQDIIDMAEQKGIILLKTDYPMFISCGKLYYWGLTGYEIEK